MTEEIEQKEIEQKEIEFKSSCWPFKIDEVNSFAYSKGAFSKEECEQIIKIGKNKGLIQGTVNKQELINIRDSKITWLHPKDNMDWVYRRCTDIVTFINNKFFNFDLYGFIEGFQFTNYKAPFGKFDRHTDKMFNGIIRKISISIQLTDPLEYEGGELYLYEDNKGTLMNKEQGTFIMFPSYILHEVTPVIKGERNSLVGWITGPAFK
jgi:PKHD-type hydroxylase